MKSIQGWQSKVGWVARKQYENSKMTTAAAAAIAEMGSPDKNIPPRPIMRPTIRENKNLWAKIAANEAKKILQGNQTGENAMEILGLKAAGDIREKITQIYEPSLSPKTVANRLRKKKNKKIIGKLTKPLIDTEQMITSLTNTVERE